MNPPPQIGIAPENQAVTFATTCGTPAITSFATSQGYRIKDFNAQANIQMITSARTEGGTWQQVITNFHASGFHLFPTNITVSSSISAGETEEILASNFDIQNQSPHLKWLRRLFVRN
jgi:hypothetical protein